MAELKSMAAGNEAGFRVLFECATIGIIVINQSGKIELLNSCTEKLFGYADEELIDSPIEFLFQKASVKNTSASFIVQLPQSP